MRRVGAVAAIAVMDEILGPRRVVRRSCGFKAGITDQKDVRIHQAIGFQDAPELVHVVEHFILEHVRECRGENDAINRTVIDRNCEVGRRLATERVVELAVGIEMMEREVRMTRRDVPLTPADRVARYVDTNIAAPGAKQVEELEGVAPDAAAHFYDRHAGRYPDKLLEVIDVRPADDFERLRSCAGQCDQVLGNMKALVVEVFKLGRNAKRMPWRDLDAGIAPAFWKRDGNAFRNDGKRVAVLKREIFELFRRDFPRLLAARDANSYHFHPPGAGPETITANERMQRRPLFR